MEEDIARMLDNQQKLSDEVNRARTEKERLTGEITTTTGRITGVEIDIKKNRDAVVAKRAEISTLNGQISSKQATIASNKASAEKATKDYYRDEINKIKAQIAVVQKALETTNNSLSNEEKRDATNQAQTKIKRECVETNTREFNTHNTNYNTNLAAARKVISECEALYNRSIDLLDDVLDKFNASISVEQYLLTAKRIMHNYLDILPFDPDKSSAAFDEIRRRRRKLKRKRKMI
jgi:chromosome segregation ATPase